MTESEILYDVFTNGVIGPHTRMLGPVADGGRIKFLTTPGCWGPMITPTLRGGHEVNVPVAVEGARVGDAVVVRFESLKVLSKASSSGVDKPVEGAFVGDPYVAKRCPVCREPWPEFEVIGIGQRARPHLASHRVRALGAPCGGVHGRPLCGGWIRALRRLTASSAPRAGPPRRLGLSALAP